MASPGEIPILLELIFGEAAGAAVHGASPRLLLWCRAFDEWLAERLKAHSKRDRNRARLAWRKLFQTCRAMPWELETADVARHAERLASQGISPMSICTDLSLVSGFYRWCAEKRIDPECEPGFNPAEGAPRPHIKPYKGTAMLSRGEIEALLAVLRADRSPIGLRDYAFILARLLLVVPLRELQGLKWRQIQVDESGAQVRWRPDAEPERLPGEVWEAIQDFLAESGRLPELTEESYVFPPMVNSGSEDPGRRPQDWSEKPLSSVALQAYLKVYGRLAGIPEEKVNHQTLRRTAIRMRVDSGDPAEKIQASAGWRRPLGNTKGLLRTVPPLPEETEEPGGREIRVREHRPRYYQPGETYKHGFFAYSHPAEVIQAVLAENVQGLDEQIRGLRALGRGLVERQLQAGSGVEPAQLVEAYTRVIGWLAEMLKAEELLAKQRKEGAGAEESLERLVDVAMKLDETSPPAPLPSLHSRQALKERGEETSPREERRREEIREAFRAEATGSEAELDLASRQLREEIATLRFNLRNTLRVAAEAQDERVYLRMVELYGKGSARLARLLLLGKMDHSRLADYLRETVDKAVEEILAGWKI